MIEELTRAGLPTVSLTLPAGQVVCLMGDSGVGKTLLLRAIADLDPNLGRVALDGVARENFAGCEWRRRVAMVPSESHWWAPRVRDHFSSIDVASFERLGFRADTPDWPVERLSSGERQRLALLRALANRPDVLLLDEPTANLDATAAGVVEGLLAAYGREAGAGLLWVTHSQQQARRVCDRTLKLNGGGIEEVKP